MTDIICKHTTSLLILGMGILLLAGPVFGFGPGLEGTVNFSATHDGENHVGANDGLEILFDARPPRISVTSPNDIGPLGGLVFGGTEITINGFVEESIYNFFDGPEQGSLYGELEWQIANSGGIVGEGTVPIIGGRFTISDIPVGLGSHSYFLVVRDGSGQRGTIFRRFFVAAEPDIHLVGLEDGQVVVESEVSLAIDFETDTTIVAFQSQPDGRAFTEGVHENVVTVPLDIGANNISFTLNAGRGDYQRAFTIFRLESLDGPEITSVEAFERTNQNPLVVEGVAPLGTSLVEVNGIVATFAPDGVTWSAPVPLNAIGSTRLTAVGYPQDRVDSLLVRLDTFPPQLPRVFPRAGTVTTDTAVDFTGRTTEPARVVFTTPDGLMSVSADTVTFETGSNIFGQDRVHRFELDTLPLEPGVNVFDVVVTDLAGNAVDRTVDIENLPPVLEIVSPMDGDSIAGTQVGVVVDVLDDVVIDAAYSGGRRIAAFEGLSLGQGQRTLPAIPLTAGSNTIRLNYHRVGRAFSEALNFKIASMADPSLFTTLEGQIVDSVTGEVLADSLVAVTVGGVTQIVVTDDEGRYSVVIDAGNVSVVATSERYSSESFGGVGTGGETLVADFTLESNGLSAVMNEVAIVVPPDGTITDFEQVTVVGTVLNPASIVFVNGTAAEVVGNRFTAKGIPLAMGANVIQAVVSVPGLPSESRTVSVDRSDTPVLDVKIYSPPAGVTVPGRGLVVRGFVSARDAIARVVGHDFVRVEQGVFVTTDVATETGIVSIVADADVFDGSSVVRGATQIEVASNERALSLTADPVAGTVPFDSTLQLSLGIPDLSIEQIDFDTDGDLVPDFVDEPTGRVAATYDVPYRFRTRALVTLSNGVELTDSVPVVATLASSFSADLLVGNPIDLAQFGSGMFVLDGALRTVSRFDVNERTTDEFIDSSSLSAPTSIAVDATNGEMFVADRGTDRVDSFDSGGEFIASLGDGELVDPTDVAVSRDRVVVAESDNDRVVVFDRASGAVVAVIPTPRPTAVTRFRQYGFLVMSSVEAPRALFEDSGRFTFVEPARLGAAGELFAVDAADGSGELWIARSNGLELVRFDRNLDSSALFDTGGLSVIAVAQGARREMPSVFVADGVRVREIELPVPSPVPTLVALKDRLANSDIPGALELIHPISRATFREIYTGIASDLAFDAAAMESFDVDLLREGQAIGIIRATEGEGAEAHVVEYPVHLLRTEDGEWSVYDY